MHAGNIKTSKRLQRTLSFIKRGWRTTKQIHDETGSMAVHSDLAALVANKIQYERKYCGTNEWGNKIYMYRVV